MTPTLRAKCCHGRHVNIKVVRKAIAAPTDATLLDPNFIAKLVDCTELSCRPIVIFQSFPILRCP